MQLSLNLDDRGPPPETTVWETLNEHQRQAVVALLARLIAKAAVGSSTPGERP